MPDGSTLAFMVLLSIMTIVFAAGAVYYGREEGMTLKCCRCGRIYEPGPESTDTHCPECLMKGMP